jgi:CRP-like cAMP-binding protein
MRSPSYLLHHEVSCRDCDVGLASGVDRGQFCPFIIRRYRRGDLLCLADAPIEHVWFVKQGVVGLTVSRELSREGEIDGLCLPGSFVGLECLVGDRYLRTARFLSAASLCGATSEGFRSWLSQSQERVEVVMRAVLEDPLLVCHARDIAARLGSRVP